MCVFP